MRKLTSLTQMLEQYVDKSKFDVFTDEGKMTKSNAKALDYRLSYRANIYINDFAGDALLLFAAVGKWMSENESRTGGDQFMSFETALERETDAFIAIELQLVENVSVKENDGELVTNAC
ncbi:phage tail protein [Wohlfahrtiimonas chitiniclastica]|uniref:phage tail protein n=1 Tax=Wohlfahrtiimonas chitiniclastica TaxID=400946 RepID=UPI001BCEB76F|nr:phage tail protein [Wohlfahrtiimonas chitiniclastica]MBS7819050.1 phage tail protein [Wohlfahrtiimonas chitiniclastica]